MASHVTPVQSITRRTTFDLIHCDFGRKSLQFFHRRSHFTTTFPLSDYDYTTYIYYSLKLNNDIRTLWIVEHTGENGVNISLYHYHNLVTSCEYTMNVASYVALISDVFITRVTYNSRLSWWIMIKTKKNIHFIHFSTIYSYLFMRSKLVQLFSSLLYYAKQDEEKYTRERIIIMPFVKFRVLRSRLVFLWFSCIEYTCIINGISSYYVWKRGDENLRLDAHYPLSRRSVSFLFIYFFPFHQLFHRTFLRSRLRCAYVASPYHISPGLPFLRLSSTI